MTGLTIHSDLPFNPETPLDRLRTCFTTLQRDFYIRSHGAVPAIAGDSHWLTVRGRVAHPLTLSARDLRGGFPMRRVMAVMQ